MYTPTIASKQEMTKSSSRSRQRQPGHRNQPAESAAHSRYGVKQLYFFLSSLQTFSVELDLLPLSSVTLYIFSELVINVLPSKIITALELKDVSPLPALSFCTWEPCGGTGNLPAFLPASGMVSDTSVAGADERMEVREQKGSLLRGTECTLVSTCTFHMCIYMYVSRAVEGILWMWWLILCLNTATSQYPDIWSNSLDVAVTVMFRWD